MKGKNEKNMMKFTTRFFLRFLIGLCINVIIVIIVKNGLSYYVMRYISGNLVDSINRYDMYYTQISVSFIIISLVSVLSTTSKNLYWVDVFQYKLIEPRYTGFVDFVAYILSCLATSTIFLFIKSNMILVSFMISIVLLAFLTIKMIGSYFGRDSVKNELSNTFLKLREGNSEQYIEVRDTLIENTYKAIDNKDYIIIVENLELLINSKEFESYITIMHYIGCVLPDLFCSSLKKYDLIFYDVDRSISDKYYQLIYSNLLNYSSNDSLYAFSISIYSLYLNGRLMQIKKAITYYEKIESNREYYKKRMELYKNYLEINRFPLGKIYKECIKNDNYKLLKELLDVYYNKVHLFEDMSKSVSNKISFLERLKQVYIVDFEIEQIITDLIKKIKMQEIDGRQINSMLRVMIDIYNKIYEIEQSEVKNNDMNSFDTLSSDMLKESYRELIVTVADAGMLSTNTYTYSYTSKKHNNEFITNILEEQKKKLIDTM